MTTWENELKSDKALESLLLEIGDGFNLLIDSTYNLEIQATSLGTVWGNEAKS